LAPYEKTEEDEKGSWGQLTGCGPAACGFFEGRMSLSVIQNVRWGLGLRI